MKRFIKKYAYLGVNQKIMTEDDFLRICELEGIEIIETTGKFSWYMVVDNVPFIVLPRRKRGIKRLFAAFHELAHHFRHYGKQPFQVFFYGLTDDKDEFEADAFSTVCICPKYALGSYDFLEEHPNKFARKLFINRQKLEFLYGI